MALMATMTLGLAGGDIAPVEAPCAIAEPVVKDFYVGVNGQALTRTVDTTYLGGVNFDDTGYGIGAQAGWVFFRTGGFSTALEGRYTYSWDNGLLGDTGVLSGYLKPAYNFGPASAYALIGYSSVDVQTIGTSDGFAWGLGLSTDLTDTFEAFVDFTTNPDFNDGTYLAVTNFDHKVITLGLNYKF